MKKLFFPFRILIGMSFPPVVCYQTLLHLEAVCCSVFKREGAMQWEENPMLHFHSGPLPYQNYAVQR